MPHPLTVLIPCKDEALNILACLRSVEPIADEILIADSGSTDDTLAIVRRFDKPFRKCRIIEREFINSGDFKNWSIPQAAHPWVLVVDADERVTPKLQAELLLSKSVACRSCPCSRARPLSIAMPFSPRTAAMATTMSFQYVQ